MAVCARWIKPLLPLAVAAALLAGCGEDEAAEQVVAKAPPAEAAPAFARPFDDQAPERIRRQIAQLKADDHAGMQQAIRDNAAGYCREGTLGAGINQLIVAGEISPSRQEQSRGFAMKDALQDAMAPLRGRYTAQQVKELYSGPMRWNGQPYVRTIVMGCFLQVAAGNGTAQPNERMPR